MQVLAIPAGLKFAWPQVAEFNYIDELVDAKLRKLRIAPSGLCDDATFLRRAYLDITGTLPPPDVVRKFLADPAADKRTAAIDSLLGRKEFSDIWVMKWAELLQIRSGINQGNNAPPFYKNALLYYNWLAERIGANVPIDRIVVELLSASGGTVSNPPVNYYQTELDKLKLSENVAQVFMGMRIQCAQCHNHPFDRRTMDDYYGFMSFFPQIGRKGTDDPRETIVFNSGGGDARHPVGNRVMAPKFLGGASPDTTGKDRRAVMANWMASPENPYFATNVSNIVWAHFFGAGIINEVDDVRVSNPPSNGELLAELGKRFTDYKYDFKKLVRDICVSKTYQRSTQTNASNEQDTRNFSHAAIRRIKAETFLDCISQVTETQNRSEEHTSELQSH